MAREYAKRPKKKNRKKPAAKKGSSRGLWLLTGLLIGLIVAGVAYIKFQYAHDTVPGHALFPDSTSQATPPKPQTVAKAKPEPQKPKFDFYTLLPEMEVAVPEPVKPAPKPQVAQKATEPASPQATPAEQARYRLQLASFKEYKEADGLKARLALSGHLVEIHSVKLKGQTWYRVYSPMMDERDQAIALQKELQKQAINSMVLKELG